MAGSWHPINPGESDNIRHTHHQVAPAASWLIEHNLNTKPTLTLVLASNPNEPVYTDVSYPDDSTAVVVWPVPVAGWAYA